jgi:hypothetical protein
MSACSVERAATAIARSTLLWLLCSVVAWSQTQTTGRIAGTVKDVQDAAIVGTQVAVENSSTGDKRAVTTDDTGSYAVPLLTPGAYVVSIAARGFATAQFTNVAVSIGETTEVNASLPLARTSYEVTVRDAPPLVQTESPQLGVGLDPHALLAVPLPTRNFLQLAVLSPGVEHAPGQQQHDWPQLPQLFGEWRARDPEQLSA